MRSGYAVLAVIMGVIFCVHSIVLWYRLRTEVPQVINLAEESARRAGGDIQALTRHLYVKPWFWFVMAGIQIILGTLLLTLNPPAPTAEQYRDKISEAAQNMRITLNGEDPYPRLRANDACEVIWVGDTMAVALFVLLLMLVLAAYTYRVHSIDGWPMALYFLLVAAGAMVAFTLEAMGS